MSPASTGPALKKNHLGSSDLLVTEVCLGTMTWGMQNTEAEGHAQLDYAVKVRGVNFIDTAELYPIPSSGPGHRSGATEEIIGTWLAKNPGIRERLVIATKVLGYSPGSKTAAHRTVPPMSEPFPNARLDAENIFAACEASLRRLQTNYIDLYQLHWPDRYTPLWGSRAYNPAREREPVPFEETVKALKVLLDAGKIKAWGVSNESSFGVCELVRTADELGVARPVTIQNQFCLMNRQFEGDLAEVCAPSNYNIGLLPWSVLAGGALTGKYCGKLDADGNPVDSSLNESRFVKFKHFQGRFVRQQNLKIVEKYQIVAKEAGMSLATLAQKWCTTRWFIPSTIIGATNMDQLKENIDAFGVELSDEILKKIDLIHDQCKDPYMAGV